MVLPLVLVVALALVQVGVVVKDRLMVEADPAAIGAAALAAAPDLDPAVTTVQVTRVGGQGAPVTVSIGYDELVNVPLIGWLFGASIHLDARATDRQEFA